MRIFIKYYKTFRQFFRGTTTRKFGVVVKGCFLLGVLAAGCGFPIPSERMEAEIYPSDQVLVDLRNQGFEGKQAIVLRKNWKFYWQQLTYDDNGYAPALLKKFVTLQQPGYWIDLPDKEGFPQGFKGFGTYTITVLLPPEHPPLAMAVPEIATAARIYVNGELLQEIGKVGRSPATHQPEYLHQQLRLPNHTDTLLICIAVSNFSHRWGGMIRPPAIGRADRLEWGFRTKLLWETFFFSVYLFIGLTSILLFLYLRREVIYLYFGLTSLFIMLRQSAIGMGVMHYFFEGLSWKFIQDARYVGFYLGFAFAGLYFQALFSRFVDSRITTGIIGISILASISVWLTPSYIGGWTSEPMQVVGAFSMIYIIWRLVVATAKGFRDAGMMLLAMSLLLAFYLHDLAVAHTLLPGPYWIHFGFLTLVIAHVIIMGRRQARVSRKNEELSQGLMAANADLEEKVLNRTQELAVKNLQLEESTRFKEKMVSMIVHDLKNPLNTLLNAPASDWHDEHEQRKHIAAQRMNDLVQNLLKISEYETGQLQLRLAPCSLGELLDVVEEQLFNAWAAKQVTISRNFSERLNLLVDERLLERVLLNLLSNAISFSPSGGTVTVSYRLEGPRVRISVRDQGPGISSADQQLIFKEFVRLEERRDSTGLGLAFCKIAVEAHGGEIGVNSSLGSGAEFFFLLPLPSERLPQEQVEIETFQAEKLVALKTILPALQALPIYKISSIRMELTKVDSKDPEVGRWKKALLDASFAGDERRYHALLDVL